MADDLRSALAQLAGCGELATVGRPIDRAWEVTAVLDRLEQDGRFPAVVFESVEGYPGWSIAGNLFATRSKIAAFLGVATGEVTETLAPVSAEPDGPVPADAGDPEALARLFLAPDADATAGGRIDIIGTNGEEEATITRGQVNLDPSFNGGGDTLTLDEEVETFTAVLLGSSVLLEGADSEVVIPVGTEGMTLAFADGTRTLVYDAELEAILIGTQTIGFTPTPLNDFA